MADKGEPPSRSSAWNREEGPAAPRDANGLRARTRLSRRDHRTIDMKDARSQNKPKISGGDSSEFGVVEFNYNPGPDAQDRLRRLFTLLVKYAARDMQLTHRTDSSPDDGARRKADALASISESHQPGLRRAVLGHSAHDRRVRRHLLGTARHPDPPGMPRRPTTVDPIRRGQRTQPPRGREGPRQPPGLPEAADIPVHLKRRDRQDDGIGRRQRTESYRIKAVGRRIRRLLGLRKRQRVSADTFVELWLGISTDEAIRMKTFRDRRIKNR